MDIAAIIGTALGASWASGINLYAAVATLGLMHRFDAIRLPGDLDACAHPAVIAIAVVMYCIEFFADKIPYVDTAWDMVHTFIRVPAGAALAAGAFGDFSPPLRLAIFMLGGGIALTAHASKAATRVAINASPEPFSNIAVSTAEDGFVFSLMALVVFHPIIAGLVVLMILAATAYLLPKLIRVLIKGLRRVADMLTGNSSRSVAEANLITPVVVEPTKPRFRLMHVATKAISWLPF